MSYIGHTFTTNVGKECHIIEETEDKIVMIVHDLWFESLKPIHWSIPKKHFEEITGEKLFFHKDFVQKSEPVEQINLF